MYDSTQREIMTVAELILAEKIGLVDGCHQLVHLFHGLDAKEWDHELFDPVVGFESESRERLLEICRGLIAKYEREPGEET